MKKGKNMKNEPNKHGYKKISTKDLVIIGLSLIALLALVFIVIFSKKKDEQAQNELNNIKNNQEQDRYFLDEALGDLIINEVNNSGWIELYNVGSSIIDLSGITIYVDGEKVFTIGQGEEIKQSAYYTIDLGHRLGEEKTSVLGLYNSEDVCTASMLIPVLAAGESYARKMDGGTTVLYITPTKGTSNTAGTVLKKEELVFSIPGGFYDSQVNLELIAPEGYKVYYTTDGTTPTTESAEYTESINIKNRTGSSYTYAGLSGVASQEGYYPASINMGTIVKAIIVSGSGQVSDVYTQSYFVGFGYGNDYANLPVVSLTINPDDMYDYFNGIYVLGRTYEDALAAGLNTNMAANFLNGWVKSAHIEYFEPNKSKTYEGNIDLSVLNDYSVYTTQKSFGLKAKDRVSLNGSSLAKYLNNANLSLDLNTNKRDNNYKLREYLVSELINGLVVAPANIYPCILFMDGEYWGGYMMQGQYDSEYFKNLYNITGDVYTAYNGGTVSDHKSATELAKLYDFIEENDLSDAKNYSKFCEMVDVQSLLDYFVTNMYLANTDYGFEEAVIWKCVDNTGSGYNDGKWRFAIGKMDNTMDNGTVGNTSTYSIDTYLQEGVRNDDIFWALMENNDFKDKLLATVKNMSENVFTEEKINASLDVVSALVERMSLRSYNRFSGNTTDNFFNDEVDKIIDFFKSRGEYMMIYTEEIISKGNSIYGEIENETTNNEDEHAGNESEDEASSETE